MHLQHPIQSIRDDPGKPEILRQAQKRPDCARISGLLQCANYSKHNPYVVLGQWEPTGEGADSDIPSSLQLCEPAGEGINGGVTEETPELIRRFLACSGSAER